MQCVAKETAFQHYYHESYRFSYQKFVQQIGAYIVDKPRQFYFESPVLKNGDYYGNKSPKKTQKGRFYDPRKRNDDVRENVGLYRNLAPEKVVDVSEVKVTVTNSGYAGVGKSNVNVKLRSRNNKRASKRDEPLVWAINDDK